MSFTTQRRFPSVHSLSLRIFIMKGSEILSRNFPLHFIFLFCSINMVNCIDFFLTIKAALHYGCKLYSIMMYYFFDILLILIFLKFRVFFIYVHEIYGSFSPVQFSHSVVSDPLRPHEPQHARPPCPSPTPGVCPNSCPLSRWCHPTISSSVVPFSSCPQSFPTSGSF